MNQIDVFQGLGEISLNLALGIIPLIAIFGIYQLFLLKLPRDYLLNIFKGIGVAVIGLVLFLQGINIGFLPAGHAIGEALGVTAHRWILIPIGLVLGFLAAFSEPSIRVLSDQVENASSGSIRKPLVIVTIAIGVSVFTGLGMARIAYGIPLLYILIPGYFIAILLILLTDRTYVSIAFDSGAVATGPMVVIFLTAVSVGIATVMDDRSTIVYGMGIVALIILAPILSVMVLGLIYRISNRREKE